MFGPYRLDAAEARLWKGDDPVSLQPRPLAVLSYLAARPGAVVGRDELIAQLWTDTHVTKAVLKVAVRAIREALEDRRRCTALPRDGRPRRLSIHRCAASLRRRRPRTGGRAAAAMVGRQPDLARLHASLMRATAGDRAIVFVTGEAGIGKTTLLDRFIAGGGIRRRRLRGARPVSGAVRRGRSVSAGARGARSPGARRRERGVARHARAARADLGRAVAGARCASRAARRAAAARWRPRRPACCARWPMRSRCSPAERTLLLVLEDLQWSDPSTVDLLAMPGAAAAAARLLVVGSLRPLERAGRRSSVAGRAARAAGEGAVRGDRARRCCRATTSRRYVAARFGGAPASRAAAPRDARPRAHRGQRAVHGQHGQRPRRRRSARLARRPVARRGVDRDGARSESPPACRS